MNKPDVWIGSFWGWVKVPHGTSQERVDALAHIAWKGGIYEDAYVARFRRWFRALAERRPDLAMVKVFDVYPVDEFRWLGPYRSSSYETPKDDEPAAGDSRTGWCRLCHDRLPDGEVMCAHHGSGPMDERWDVASKP
jgi:hypothetical protein